MSLAADPNPPADALGVLTKTAVKASDHVLSLLRRLHKLSLDQEHALKNDQAIQKLRKDETMPADQRKQFFDNIMRDKFIALTPDKSVFMYNLVRASGALNVIECGTSYGVSTIYLALAVGQNATQQRKTAGDAKVIATENEPGKAEQARKHWKEAGESVEPWIDLWEGDLTQVCDTGAGILKPILIAENQTLRKDLPLIDFVLFDIWTPMVMPTLKILEPNLKAGAVLLADNTLASSSGYADFLNHVRADGAPYSDITLPYQDGLEMVIYTP